MWKIYLGITSVFHELEFIDAWLRHFFLFNGTKKISFSSITFFLVTVCLLNSFKEHLEWFLNMEIFSFISSVKSKSG